MTVPLPNTAGGINWLIRRVLGSNDSDISTTQTETEASVEEVKITRDSLFKKLWKNYPVNSSALEAYTLVGGQALALHIENPKAYANACALRFSRSFNYSGYTIATSDSSRGGSAKGADNKIYLLRVKDAIKLVTKHFGQPTSTFSSTQISMSEVRNQLAEKTGIIIFDVTGWNNATGHVTLWNGYDCGDKCYFYHHGSAQTTEVIFWEVK